MNSFSNGTGTTKSHTTTTYSSASVRPRAKRFITGFEEYSEEDSATTSATGGSPTATNSSHHNTSNVNGAQNNNATPAPAAHDYSSYFFPRIPSPIPSKHPSRSSSLKPPSSRGLSSSNLSHSGVEGDLAASLSGLFGRSWTSLQGLASNVLGSDASVDSIKDNPNGPKRATPNSSRPGTAKQWGPVGAPQQTQLGAGSKQERSAVVRAKKRQELLSSSGLPYRTNSTTSHKRRTSDDFGSASAPPAETDDRDTLAYVHHVTPRDTLPGISIRYNCQLVTLKRVNRLWTNDGVQARKTLIIPLASCTMKGKRVDSPVRAASSTGQISKSWNWPSGSVQSSREDVSSTLTAAERENRRSSTATITPRNVSSASTSAANGIGLGFASQEKLIGGDDDRWTHDSWIILEGQTEPTEIVRLPRQTLGYFPRSRRKSGSLSDFDRSSTSLDMPRLSVTMSETSSTTGRTSRHRSRRSSGSNQFAQQMMGPGGVGSLKGKGPSTLGPAEDKLTKVFRKQLPSVMAQPHASDDDLSYPSTASTPNFSDISHAVEGWAKKVSKGIAKALEPPAPNTLREQRRAAGISSTTTGDLIELENAFDSVDLNDNNGDNHNVRRGRRDSLGRLNSDRDRLMVYERPEISSRSSSHGDDRYRRKGD